MGGEVKGYCYGCTEGGKPIAFNLRNDKWGICDECVKTLSPFQKAILGLMDDALEAIWSIEQK